MNLLDAFLVAAVILAALSGFRHGFVIAITALGGFLVGAYAGLRLAPALLSDAPQVFSTTVVALVIMITLATVGQVLGLLLGRYLRGLITWRPARLVDSSAGALTGVVYALVAAWAIGVAVVGVGVPTATPLVRESSVLGAVDRALPGGPDVIGRFTSLLDRSGFPRVLGPFSPEPIVPVPAPEELESITGAVLAAEPSVVRVAGDAPSCDRRLTGSGWVYAPGVVVTNAHVVAGVTQPTVSQPGGRTYGAEVVLFDPSVDLAVLRVPELGAAALPLGSSQADGNPVAILGYPGGGDLVVAPARVRTSETIIGPDIYGEQDVARDVYVLRAEVRAGESGGPLLAPDGSVVGVVFAASLDDPETAYALTAEEVRPVAEAGARASTAAPTGACA